MNSIVSLSKLSYFLFLSIAIQCCWSSPSSVDCDTVMQRIRLNERDAKRPICIVLCDFSSSMDSGSVRYVQEQAMEVFDRFYNKAIIKFYPVTSASRKAMFESDMIVLADTSAISEPDYFNFQKCQKSIEIKYRDSFAHILKYQLEERPHATYIIQSLENAINVISLADPKRENKNIIYILSDMLELGISTFGRINLEDRSYAEDIKKVQTAVVSNRVSDLRNIDIRVGLYTQRLKNLSQLSDFWNLVLQKFGYKKPLILSSELIFN